MLEPKWEIRDRNGLGNPTSYKLDLGVDWLDVVVTRMHGDTRGMWFLRSPTFRREWYELSTNLDDAKHQTLMLVGIYARQLRRAVNTKP